MLSTRQNLQLRVTRIFLKTDSSAGTLPITETVNFKNAFFP